jgi:hypothetical protein
MLSEIWIPSKGRSGPVFSKALCNEGIPHTVWVEPQDQELYKSAIDNPLVIYKVLPLNNQGITYVRQLMLDECRNRGIKIFMMDDDMKGFLSISDPTEPGKWARKKSSISLKDALEKSETLFMHEGLAYGSWVFSVFAHASESGFTKCKADTGSIWLDGTKLPSNVNYDNVSGREDLYFVTLLMLSGALCGKYFDIAVDHAPVASPNMKGGLAGWYANWQNVIDANQNWMKVLNRIQAEMLASLSPADRVKLSNKSLYREKTIKVGQRKGLSDTMPNWRNIVNLRNAYFAGTLPPI